MILRWERFVVTAFACAFAWVAMAAPLTEAEKKLLSSSVTESTARELGKSGDTAALERIIAIGDPQLVHMYFIGLEGTVGREMLMPPAIEALVVKHYDNPRVGERLWSSQLNYQTRALFDLHYARAKVAYLKDDPVFR